MEKVTKVQWTPEIDALFSDFENKRALKACVTQGNGEVFQIDKLTVIVRLEVLPDESGFEVVWMASQGEGLKKHIPTFIDAAKRNGAKHIRFHTSVDEMAVLRLVQSFEPREVERVYRVDLGGD